LSDKDARIRADAGNALARLRAKNENTNAKMRALLLADDDAVVRANAARVLGGAEDKMAFEMLVEAATTDDDSRVRVAAIRALASLKDKKATEPLLVHAEKLLAAYKTAKTKIANPAEKNELLEIATTLGRILPNSNEDRTVKFLMNFRDFALDGGASPETEIALARINPKNYSSIVLQLTPKIKLLIESANEIDWRTLSSIAQGLSELANPENKEIDASVRKEGEETALFIFKQFKNNRVKNFENQFIKAVPDVIRALAAFKTNNLAEILREQLEDKNVIVRATAVELRQFAAGTNPVWRF
jgi:HEAT repeat protein